MNHKTLPAGLALLLMISATAQAGNWQIGLLADNTQSPYIDQARDTKLLPLVNYTGERFSFISGELNYRLVSSESAELGLVGSMRSRDFYRASLETDDELQDQGLQERDGAFETGLNWQQQAEWGQLSLQGLFDVSDTHRGYEVTARYSYPKLTGRWMIEPAVGLQWQSERLVDYYHGVRESEARADLPAYHAGQAVTVLTALNVVYGLGQRWMMLGGIELLMLDKSIRNSPIIKEEQVGKVFLGLLYSF